MEVSKLFNGMQIRSAVESEPGTTASQERLTPESYALELTVKVKVPRPNRDLASLSKLNEALPWILPGLDAMLPTARVADQYEALYQRKLTRLQRNLTRLDALMTRHNFFDCETMLQLRHPQTKRTLLLLQADMDVDTDGSDPDRLPAVDANDPTFQPMTSYRWPKRTSLTNPFLPRSQARLKALETELAQSKHLGAPRIQALRDAVGAARYEVNQLKTCSFLLAATDPYVVLPGLLADGFDPAFQPRVGDYCAVVYGDTIYPAIIGDIGPRDVVGEASLRIGKTLNPQTSGLTRSVSPLKVTYLYFPNTADQPFGPPDLPHMRQRVEALLKEVGGYGGTLHTWEELSRPAPTPTPSPSPSPLPPWLPPPSIGGAASPAVEVPSLVPTPGTLPSATPAAGPTATPAAAPTATPSATPAPSSTPASRTPEVIPVSTRPQ